MQPRDERQDAEEELEEGDDDPNDPAHPDHDLSSSAPFQPYEYTGEEPSKPWYAQRWVLLIVAFFVISSLIIPFIRVI